MLIPQLFCHAEWGIAPGCVFGVFSVDMNWHGHWHELTMWWAQSTRNWQVLCVEDVLKPAVLDWELHFGKLQIRFSKVIIFWISVFSKLIFIVLWDRFNEIPECDCCSSRCCRCCRRCFYYCFWKKNTLDLFPVMDYPRLVTRNEKNPRWWFLPKWLYRVAPQYSPVTIAII